ncbi:fimbrial protein [Nitratireductor luteus]|uniref:fimbrial protein n=1 Tax=Nitratireductor luteus TaxID=2976980 RepID=UPI00223F44AA|nr:fimbrial protein [Nitratireductor luteus]
MAKPTLNEIEDEAPLDPAAERVRRKLVRFMGINLAILFAAVMAVVLTVVYRSVTPEPAEPQMASSSVPGEVLSGEVAIPAGARIVSHALSGSRLSLLLRLDGGDSLILVYDFASGEPAARIAISEEEL